MLFDQTFLEKIVFLVITAVITGFGIPYVLKRIEERKLREQKKFEADLARQNKIIEAQSKLLDNLTELLWNWRYLAKKVVYYSAENDMKRYDLAKKQYEEDVWCVFHKFRVEISKSRRLASESAYKELDSLYKYVTKDIDIKVNAIIRAKEPDVIKSETLSKRFHYEVSKRLDEVLDGLASELNLKVKA